MPDFPPTEEQSAILAAERDTRDNLLIDALAGAAKTTTLEMLSHQIEGPTLAIAFNKKIAMELQKRMSANTTSKTMHSLGLGVAQSFLGVRRADIDFDKRKRLLQETIPRLGADTAQYELMQENFMDLLGAIRFGAECGWIPDAAKRNATPLMDDTDFLHHFEGWENSWKISDIEWEAIRKTSELAVFEAVNDNKLDFTDMLLIPACYNVRFPYYGTIMVDEAQDLNALNHRILDKMMKKSRLIAVGDPCQAIYGFRAAHEDSMERLAEKFAMRYLPLTISFRCAESVVKHVQWRAPHMRFRKGAPLGSVRTVNEWTAAMIPDGEPVAVICRNNAPLFALAMKLLKAGRRPQLSSGDVLAGIEKDLKKIGPVATAQEDAIPLFEAFRDKMFKKYGQKQFLTDKLDCILDFIMGAETIGGAIRAVQKLSNSTGPITLTTGHKSKGLEWDTVFFLDEHIIGKEGQEKNLRYVIATRAKKELIYVKSDDYS